MYNEPTSSVGVITPGVTTATVAILPATGADIITTLALSVFLGLATWALIYAYKLKRGNQI